MEHEEQPFEHELKQEFEQKVELKAFCLALQVACEDISLLQRFLWEITSFKERKTLAGRWEAMRLLLEGNSQAKTARITGFSTKTVNTSARWATGPYTTHGCADVLERIKQREQEATRGKTDAAE
ncbi:MAG TPA: Trp family transcriptional regulator [Chloroflexia bacterium]|nr:Trp family transcriptional regulator [Chloroflexia bacterium]